MSHLQPARLVRELKHSEATLATLSGSAKPGKGVRNLKHRLADDASLAPRMIAAHLSRFEIAGLSTTSVKLTQYKSSDALQRKNTGGGCGCGGGGAGAVGDRAERRAAVQERSVAVAACCTIATARTQYIMPSLKWQCWLAGNCRA